MKNGGIRRMLFFAAVLAASAGLWGADHYRVVNGPKDFYFGHISYIEPTAEGTDPVVLREGRSEPEPGRSQHAHRPGRHRPDVGRPALRDPVRHGDDRPSRCRRPSSGSRPSWPAA
ncbi:MAG: hypothetical protein MZU95_06795 [Desulfomicrobium escambiense]|nr:hypothetical protein [Desulfomicrobium escambiense]